MVCGLFVSFVSPSVGGSRAHLYVSQAFGNGRGHDDGSRRDERRDEEDGAQAALFNAEPRAKVKRHPGPAPN